MAVNAKKINQLPVIPGSTSPLNIDIPVGNSLDGKAYKASIKQLNDRLEGLNKLTYNLLNYANMAADGTNDFTAIFTELISKLSAAGGGTIFIPNGKYIVNNVVILSNISVVGEDIHNTILYPTGTNSAIKGDNSATNPTTDVLLKNFTVDGVLQDAIPYVVQAKGVFITHIINSVCKDLIIKNTVATGFGCDTFQYGLVQNVTAINCGRGSTGPTTPGSSGLGIGTGGWEIGAEPLIIDSCVAIGCGQYGIFFETQLVGSHGGGKPYGCIVSNCYATGNRIGFGSSGCTGLIWQGCSANANKEAGFSADSGSYKQTTESSRVTINVSWSNCVSSQNGIGSVTGENYEFGNGFIIKGEQNAYGFYLNNCVSLENDADGLAIYNPTASNRVNNVFISGGNYSSNKRHGINFLNNTIKNVSLRGVFINKNLQTGLRIDSNLTNAIIKDSIISENKIGVELDDSKALTNYIFRDNLVFDNTTSDLLNISQN